MIRIYNHFVVIVLSTLLWCLPTDLCALTAQEILDHCRGYLLVTPDTLTLRRPCQRRQQKQHCCRQQAESNPLLTHTHSSFSCCCGKKPLSFLLAENIFPDLDLNQESHSSAKRQWTRNRKISQDRPPGHKGPTTATARPARHDT